MNDTPAITAIIQTYQLIAKKYQISEEEALVALSYAFANVGPEDRTVESLLCAIECGVANLKTMKEEDLCQ